MLIHLFRSFVSLGLSLVGYLLLATSIAVAQGSEFTYQGRLTDSAAPAGASYDMEFKLFTDVVTGSQVGSTQTVNGVTAVNGIFQVTLDFGASAFPGTARFLEISVRPTGSGGFTTLSPRQAITSAPYAARALGAGTAQNALDSASLIGIPGANFVQTTDSRLSDARDPLPGSPNYVQSSPASQQLGVNFNIGGTGKAAIIEAGSYFALNGTRMLRVGPSDPSSLYIGHGAGNAITISSYNLFVGQQAGANTTWGNNNTFVGADAGLANTQGFNNAFVGSGTGSNNSTGYYNAFFGSGAGTSNTTASGNSFFGSGSGASNTTGANNSFFGNFSGFFTATGVDNTFFGANSGRDNVVGSNNVFAGSGSGFANISGSGNLFLGKDSGKVNTHGSNNIFLGLAAGGKNTAGHGSVFIGRVAAPENTTGFNNVFVGDATGVTNTIGSFNTMIGAFANTSSANLQYATAVGADAVVTSSNTVALGRSVDVVRVPGFIDIGSTVSSQIRFNGSKILHNPGAGNIFAGENAGAAFTDGFNNAFYGSRAGFAQTNATSNSLFGARSGEDITTGSANTFIGSQAGLNTTTGGSNIFIGTNSGSNNTTGFSNIFIGNSNTGGSGTTQISNSIIIGTAVQSSTNFSIVLGNENHTARIPGLVRLTTGASETGFGTAATYGTGGNSGLIATNVIVRDLDTYLASPVHVCARTVSIGNGDGGEGGLVRCSAAFTSAGQKTNARPFSSGLDVLRRLNPIAFTNSSGQGDIGINIEEISAASPELIATEGGVTDVKHGAIELILINAIKEQQKQIDALKKIICGLSPDACRPMRP